jgi:uncharacterized coiled-coil DUF342 family protein
MSDSGLAAALLISQKLSMYRWEDHFEKRRNGLAEADNGALRQNIEALIHHYNVLLQRHNQLVGDCDGLRSRAFAFEAERDQLVEAVAQLREEKAEWQAEREDLRDKLAQARLSAKLRGNIVKQYDPDFYTSD